MVISKEAFIKAREQEAAAKVRAVQGEVQPDLSEQTRQRQREELKDLADRPDPMYVQPPTPRSVDQKSLTYPGISESVPKGTKIY